MSDDPTPTNRPDNDPAKTPERAVPGDPFAGLSIDFGGASGDVAATGGGPAVIGDGGSSNGSGAAISFGAPISVGAIADAPAGGGRLERAGVT